MSLAIAACGGKDQPQKERALTPPPIDESPAPLPTATADDVSKSWPMPELASVLQSGALVSATATDAGVVLKRSGEGEDDSRGRTSGAFIAIPASHTLDFSGLTYEVKITAQSSTDDNAAFRAAFSTATKGNSGWFDFEASSEPTTVSFSYTIPEGYDVTRDFLGISVNAGVEVLITEVSVSPAS